jgi:ribosomal protein S18 acetylase RimI-like enzyme
LARVGSTSSTYCRARRGGGIGTSLLNIAQQASDRLQLWTFQRNTNARRFYERRGFALVRKTDGSRNEEKEPDALYRWTRSGANYFPTPALQ